MSLYVCDPLNQALTCEDDDGNDVFNAPPGLYQALFNLPSYTRFNNQVRQFQQEVRLVSKPYEPGGLPFTWLVGVYVSSEYSQGRPTNETVQGANAAFSRFNADPSDPTIISGGAPGFIVNDKVYSGFQSYNTSQYAVFGEDGRIIRRRISGLRSAAATCMRATARIPTTSISTAMG
ncbi:MAG: hypothetical protein WDN04_08110 [Rhodospirillales bacterium]